MKRIYPQKGNFENDPKILRFIFIGVFLGTFFTTVIVEKWDSQKNNLSIVKEEIKNSSKSEADEKYVEWFNDITEDLNQSFGQLKNAQNAQDLYTMADIEGLPAVIDKKNIVLEKVQNYPVPISDELKVINRDLQEGIKLYGHAEVDSELFVSKGSSYSDYMRKAQEKFDLAQKKMDEYIQSLNGFF